MVTQRYDAVMLNEKHVTLHHTSISVTMTFPSALDQLVLIQLNSSTSVGGELLHSFRINGTVFYSPVYLLVTQPTVSEHRRKPLFNEHVNTTYIFSETSLSWHSIAFVMTVVVLSIFCEY